MAQAYYKVLNQASPTGNTLAAGQTTTTSTKTHIQLLHPSLAMNVIAWGVMFNQSAAATPVTCELSTTTTVAATVTAYVANDVQLYNMPFGNTPGLTLSTSGSGFNASAEGTVVAPVRVGDVQLVQPTNNQWYQWPLGQEFVVKAADVLRVRINSGTSYTCLCWVIFGLS